MDLTTGLIEGYLIESKQISYENDNNDNTQIKNHSILTDDSIQSISFIYSIDLIYRKNCSESNAILAKFGNQDRGNKEIFAPIRVFHLPIP